MPQLVQGRFIRLQHAIDKLCLAAAGKLLDVLLELRFNLLLANGDILGLAGAFNDETVDVQVESLRPVAVDQVFAELLTGQRRVAIDYGDDLLRRTRWQNLFTLSFVELESWRSGF